MTSNTKQEWRSLMCRAIPKTSTNYNLSNKMQNIIMTTRIMGISFLAKWQSPNTPVIRIHFFGHPGKADPSFGSDPTLGAPFLVLILVSPLPTVVHPNTAKL